MFDTILSLLVLSPRHLVLSTQGRPIGIQVSTLEIPESQLLTRLSLSPIQTVKVEVRPLVFNCSYKNYKFSAIFYSDRMVIQ